jgi:hypothetical protein
MIIDTERMSAEEKLAAAMDLWDSCWEPQATDGRRAHDGDVSYGVDASAPDPQLVALLDARLASYRAHPQRVHTWDDVMTAYRRRRG